MASKPRHGAPAPEHEAAREAAREEAAHEAEPAGKTDPEPDHEPAHRPDDEPCHDEAKRSWSWRPHRDAPPFKVSRAVLGHLDSDVSERALSVLKQIPGRSLPGTWRVCGRQDAVQEMIFDVLR